jgi:hypothetical protein
VDTFLKLVGWRPGDDSAPLFSRRSAFRTWLVFAVVFWPSCSG